MSFISNLFRKAEKDFKVTYSDKTGNINFGNCEGYNKAIIQFSSECSNRFLGYVDRATDSTVISYLQRTDINGNLIESNWVSNYRNMVVNISNVASFFVTIDSDTPFTGTIYVHLTQDEFKFNERITTGVTNIANQTITITEGTNRYSTNWFSGDLHQYRFLGIMIRRVDGNGYSYFQADFLEYHRVVHASDAGPNYSGGTYVLKMVQADNYAQSDWFENRCTKESADEIEFDIIIDSTTYNNAMLEINLIGIK